MHDGDVRRKTMREEMLALQEDRDTVAMRLAAAEGRESELMKGYGRLQQESTEIQEEYSALQEQFLALQEHVRVSDDDLSQTQEMLQSLTLEYQNFKQTSESNAEENQGQYEQLADQLRSLVEEYSNYKESSDAFRVETTTQISQFEEREVMTQKELLALNHQKTNADTNLTVVTKELHECRIAAVAEQERLSSLLRDLAMEFQKFKSETEIIITGLNHELHVSVERSSLTSTDLESLNEKLSAQLRDLRKEFNNFKDVSERRVMDMETKASADSSTIAALTASKAAAEEQISALTMESMNGSEQAIALKMRVSELEAALSKSIDECVKLHTQEQSDKATIASLTSQFQEAKEMSVALATEYEAFKNHTVTTITGLNADLGATRDRSLSSNAELEASVDQLKDTLQALTAEFLEYKQHTVANASDLEASLKKTLGESESTAQSYQALSAAKAASDARIFELEEQSAKGKIDTVALQAQLTERNDKLAKLSQELATAMQSCQELATAKAESDARISELEGQGSKVKGDMTALQALLTKVSQEYVEFKSASEQRETVAEQSIQELNTRLTAAQDRSLQSHSELSDANAQLTDSLMALAKEFQSYKALAELRATDLEANASQDHEALLTTRQKLLALAAEYEDMLNQCNEKVSRANHDLSERTKDMEALRCEVESLQSWRAMAQANEADMNKAYAELQTQFNSLQQNYDELSSRDQDSNLQSSTLKGNLSALVAEYSKYKETMENESKSLYAQLAECKEQWSATAKEYQRLPSLLSHNTYTSPLRLFPPNFFRFFI